MPVYRNRWPNFCIICIHVRQVSVIWSIMFSAFSHSSWMMTQGKTIFVYSYLLVSLSLLTHNYDKFGSIVYGLFFKLPSPVCSSFSDILWTPSQPWRLVSSLPVGFSAEIVGPYVKMWLRETRSWVNLWKLLQIVVCWVIWRYYFPFSCLMCFLFCHPWNDNEILAIFFVADNMHIKRPFPLLTHSAI